MHRIISTAEFESDAFATQWRALLERCTHYDEGQTECWNRCWWRHYGTSSGKELFVVVEEEDGQLLSLWPLFLRKRFGLRVLSWIGQVDGMITDYTMPLLPDHHREKGSRAFIEFLADNTSRWDVADLSIPGWSGLLSVMVKSVAVHGMRRKLSWDTHIIEHTSPVDMGTSFDTYVASLGRNSRENVRRFLRDADRLGATFEIARGRDCAAWLPDLLRLNRRRWKVFEDPRAREFITSYIAGLPIGNESVFLARLRIQDNVLATVLGFDSHGTCYMHAGGIDRDAPGKLNAGTAMWMMLFKAMIAGGHTRLDWGPGVEEYKLLLGANVDSLFGMTIWHSPSAINRWRLGQSLVAVRRWVLSARHSMATK
jgi:CelD/BcsL family acetyltransferase involved in cellulose biosynthesis